MCPETGTYAQLLKFFMMNNEVNRYSDADLEEFRQLIEGKLVKAREELQELSAQILEITENSGDDFGIDWMDDSNVSSDLDLLNDMAIRQRKYVNDLENALIRISNKTYGICVVTGELIDKKRLLAVPTTTKSLAAKIEQQSRPQPVVSSEESIEDSETPEKGEDQKTPKIITKILRKPNPNKPVVRDSVDDLEFDTEEDITEDSDEPYIDLDTIADEEEERDYEF